VRLLPSSVSFKVVRETNVLQPTGWIHNLPGKQG
jgi:hypothetical protein